MRRYASMSNEETRRVFYPYMVWNARAYAKRQAWRVWCARMRFID